MGWGDVKRQCRPIHTKDDTDYASGCMKKRRFTNKVEAEKVCRAMANKHNKSFNVYPCRFCESLHIGSLNEGLK